MASINNKIILFVLLIGLLLNSSPIFSAPYIPEFGDEVLLLLDKSSQRSQFSEINSRLTENKAFPNKLISILQETMDYGKSTSDPRYIGFASSYVDRYLRKNNQNNSFKILKANILQHDHKFNDALTLLNSVINNDSELTSAHLLRASILQVQANYNGARKDCYSLLGKTSHLITLTCIAQIDGLTKSTEQNYNALYRIINNYKNHDANELSWSYDILAQLALQLGKNAEAKQHLKQAVALAPDNASILNSYADLLISENDFGLVINLLKHKNQDFTVLLRLAIAEKLSSTNSFYKDQFLSRLVRMQEISDLTHQREIAAFYLYVDKDIDKALVHAIDNWNVQKELYDAQLLLQCALLKMNTSLAIPVIEWYTKNSISDIRLTKLVKLLNINTKTNATLVVKL